MSDNISLFALLDLPDPQRELLLWLTRHGPADASNLVQSTGLDPAKAQQALDALIDQGHVQRLADGRVVAVAGRVRSRTTLPADLWHALPSTDRHYSEQEIATLRTAIPMLQLARAHLVSFADHGPGHVLRVKSFAGQLGCIVGLSEFEHRLLRLAALFHDVGNIVDRKEHHVISQETVLRLTADGALPFTPQEAVVVGLLCRWHRREYDPGRRDELNGLTVRTGLLASILRVADSMDLDHRRSDYPARWFQVVRFFYSEQLHWWTSLEEIPGVRIRCTPAVELQVFTQEDVKDNVLIGLLRNDLAGTPFPWVIRQIPVREGRSDDSARLEQAPQPGNGAALLAFPFEVLDDPELAGMELTGRLAEPASLSLDDLDTCRLLENFMAAKRILSLVDEVDFSHMEAAGVDLEKSGKGIGVVEAPRGVLAHSYLVKRGIMECMSLLVATQFNNAYINLVLQDLVGSHVERDGLSAEGEKLVARCVRTFDPCLTCATH